MCQCYMEKNKNVTLHEMTKYDIPITYAKFQQDPFSSSAAISGNSWWVPSPPLHGRALSIFSICGYLKIKCHKYLKKSQLIQVYYMPVNETGAIQSRLEKFIDCAEADCANINTENSHPLCQVPSHTDAPNSSKNQHIWFTFFSWLDNFLTFKKISLC